jgi:diadenosine tetraphosphate (Ap4A) HIT family hydrolase
VCIVAKEHVVEPFEMSPDDQTRFWREVVMVSRAVADVVHPMNVNYEIHGDTVPHLHLHVFPRNADDPFVGGPIDARAAVLERSDTELDALASAIRAAGEDASGPATEQPRDDHATRGPLLDSDAAPTVGEHTVVLARGHGFTIEQILSGRLAAPVDYRQDHDEWVVVLDGGAVLEVDGVAHQLTPKDWFLLPANVPHRLVSTEPGTSWLAVRSTRYAR